MTSCEIILLIGLFIGCLIGGYWAGWQDREIWEQKRRGVK